MVPHLGQQLKCDYISGFLGHLVVYKESGGKLSSIAENKSQRNGTSANRYKSARQDGANASVSS